MDFRTMADVRRANSESGGHWFDRGAMRFFSTRIETKLCAGKYFVTSECYGAGYPRLYSVREVSADGSVRTVGEFQAYKTLEDAKREIMYLTTI